MSASFLGKGWKFPVQVDATTGRILMADAEEDIAEAIRIIIRTSKGERLMRPDFGCGLREFVFGTTDETSLRLISSEVTDAIRIWEPRVKDIEVKAQLDPQHTGRVLLTVSYAVRSTNNLFNQVYPFYLEEGTK
ncbi:MULTISPECIES: GPW/gp25 family protein [Paenibacillus]|jgi:phage baseplate assembly protein W|uniref:Phage baseplate assembly protein W n=1 Tax=Paenibacillus harenae TaxID=306543 RepID=A0ABT9TXT2_PAEHA|nr:GPW/gp25 family protein [Paenibacillus harenae]MDQ0061128.1 phage baseplate assembly protein W [Paenibacillus harenae]MDQ0110999.1 phage baseplate assembly protein W [Paenibacillus harenae]